MVSLSELHSMMGCCFFCFFCTLFLEKFSSRLLFFFFVTCFQQQLLSCVSQDLCLHLCMFSFRLCCHHFCEWHYFYWRYVTWVAGRDSTIRKRWWLRSCDTRCWWWLVSWGRWLVRLLSRVGSVCDHGWCIGFLWEDIPIDRKDTSGPESWQDISWCHCWQEGLMHNLLDGINGSSLSRVDLHPTVHGLVVICLKWPIDWCIQGLHFMGCMRWQIEHHGSILPRYLHRLQWDVCRMVVKDQ